MLEKLQNVWTRLQPRLLSFIALAIACFFTMDYLAPEQFPVAVYKLTLITVAACFGYWLDRALFPYARPDAFLVDDWRRTTVAEFGSPGAVDYPIVGGYQKIYAAAMLRRAIVVFAVILGVATGL